MANVLIVSSASDAKGFDPWKHGTTFMLQASADVDSFGQHHLTDDPKKADIILFAEMGECGFFAERVRAHPYYRKYPEKCFLFDSADTIWPVLPGIYASLTKQRYEPDHTRAGFYLYLIENPFVVNMPITGKEKYLAAFFGSRVTHPVREAIFAYNRPDIAVKDASAVSYHMMYHGTPAERSQFWGEYADAMADSLFSLCPRGRCVGSIRLFESMKMGRACVILSDDLYRHEGVDWDSFSITVPEADADKVPEILDRYKDHAAEMGACARREWEKWFSEQVRFHRVTEQCLDMLSKRRTHGWRRRLYHLRHIAASPMSLRSYLRSKRNLYNREGRLFW